MKVELAKEAGYCYGVQRALNLTYKALNNSPRPIYTLGSLIHNPQVVQCLQEEGIFAVKPSQARKGTIIVSSHGAEPQILKELKDKGVQVIDATCPYVKKAQRCAAKLVKEGYCLVIVGEFEHPEVRGILAQVQGKALVAQRIADLKGLNETKKVGVVVQTTQSLHFLKQVLTSLLPLTSELKVFNTICDDTIKRQEAARELAQRVEVMIVVGGKNSANTTRLSQICQKAGIPTYHVEVASEIEPSWFKGKCLVGVTAGASTPNWIVKEVLKILKAIDTQG